MRDATHGGMGLSRHSLASDSMARRPPIEGRGALEGIDPDSPRGKTDPDIRLGRD
ncbi:MAG: hypothetical protein ISN28_09595 [Ectothiorhodospiraceae bacterium AqS1]|nr:hypothetical protein [Ectothiorhodospiraceae bacterium AqS1]